jgi:hypothetical protein
MSYSNGPRIVTDGLVLYLDAGNSKSYPGTGTVWNDLSGNNNNGTLVNGPTFSSANKGSIVFDGVNDGCNINNNSFINPTNAITFGAIVNLSGYGSNYAPIIFKQNNYTSLYEQYALYLTNSSVGAAVTGVDRSQKIVSINQDLRNQYLHLVGTCDTETNLLSFYLNGSLIQSVAFTSTFDISTQNLRIGYMDSNYLGFSLGKIFITYIYNRALSPTEILQNYNATKGRFNL